MLLIGGNLLMAGAQISAEAERFVRAVGDFGLGLAGSGDVSGDAV